MNVGGQCSALERFGVVLTSEVKERIPWLTIKENGWKYVDYISTGLKMC